MINTMRSFKYAPFICMTMFILLSKSTTCRADVNDTDVGSLATAVPILLQLQEKWSSIHTLKYDIEVRDTESEGFRHQVGHG